MKKLCIQFIFSITSMILISPSFATSLPTHLIYCPETAICDNSNGLSGCQMQPGIITGTAVSETCYASSPGKKCSLPGKYVFMDAITSYTGNAHTTCAYINKQSGSPSEGTAIYFKTNGVYKAYTKQTGVAANEWVPIFEGKEYGCTQAGQLKTQDCPFKGS